MNALKLEFGCGENVPRDGFLGVDIRPYSHVKFVCNVWEINKYIPGETVSEIYSRHMFEHLTFVQADMTLKVWSHLLLSKGIVQIILPDLAYHIKQFNSDHSLPSEANSNWTNLQHALAGFWGWQRDGDTEMWDVHKSGYDYVCLKKKLEQFGFVNIGRLADDPWNLNVICEKP